MLDVNPILWLVGRDRLKSAYGFGLLLVIGLVWLWLFLAYRRAMLESAVCFLTAYALHSVLKLWLASEACRPFAEDRRTGALELVLATRLTVDDILEGALLALKRQFAGPVAIVLCADIVLLVVGFSDPDSPIEWLFLCVGLIGLFVADLYTLAWAGMWLGLTSKKRSRAAWGNVARVLVLPWAIFVFGVSALAMIPWVQYEPTEPGLLSAGFALAGIVDIVLLAWARPNLRQRFRLLAAERFESKAIPQTVAPAPPLEQPAAPIPV